MKRTWACRPDQEMYLQDGRVLHVVSREARLAALADAEVVQERCGGFITAQSLRSPTEIPGEMVTTLFVVVWQDRTDAKDQPEQPAAVAPAPQFVDFEEGEVEFEALDTPEESETITGEGDGGEVVVPDDELPEIGEDAEDEAAIPASAR